MTAVGYERPFDEAGKGRIALRQGAAVTEAKTLACPAGVA